MPRQLTSNTSRKCSAPPTWVADPGFVEAYLRNGELLRFDWVSTCKCNPPHQNPLYLRQIFLMSSPSWIRKILLIRPFLTLRPALLSTTSTHHYTWIECTTLKCEYTAYLIPVVYFCALPVLYFCTFIPLKFWLCGSVLYCIFEEYLWTY